MCELSASLSYDFFFFFFLPFIGGDTASRSASCFARIIAQTLRSRRRYWDARGRRTRTSRQRRRLQWRGTNVADAGFAQRHYTRYIHLWLSICMYVYIYIYIYIYVCVCVCICYRSVYICMTGRPFAVARQEPCRCWPPWTTLRAVHISLYINMYIYKHISIYTDL